MCGGTKGDGDKTDLCYKYNPSLDEWTETGGTMSEMRSFGSGSGFDSSGS